LGAEALEKQTIDHSAEKQTIDIHSAEKLSAEKYSPEKLSPEKLDELVELDETREEQEPTFPKDNSPKKDRQELVKAT
jgi:hypothetical protein